MPDGADDDDPTFDTANSTVARLRALQSSQEQRLKLTREELLRFETQLLWLVNSGIRLRYQRRGRWRKEDTARRTYVYTIALPNLRRREAPAGAGLGIPLYGSTRAACRREVAVRCCSGI